MESGNSQSCKAIAQQFIPVTENGELLMCRRCGATVTQNQVQHTCHGKVPGLRK